VLTTVELDGDSAVGTVEVEDEWADRMLAAELQVGEPALTEQAPEQTLGIGTVLS
jgi:hypothetical protein